MNNKDLKGREKDKINLQRRRKYRPFMDNDRVDLEMSSMDPGSSSTSSRDPIIPIILLIPSIFFSC